MPYKPTKSQPRKQDYKTGNLESVKFAHRKDDYYEALQTIENMGYSTADYLHQFPAFVGHMTLWRNLTLYEFYKKTLGICGHIADIGVHMGASSLLFGTLTQIYEPEALTQVHGFDWFKGASASREDTLLIDGAYAEDEKRLRKLIKIQKLDHIIHVHNMDLTKDIDRFFKKYPHLRFKLIFCDSGTYAVTSSVIRAFWPRLVPGGIIIFDQFNHEVAPGEARAVSELLPEMRVQTIPNSWMPNAYVQKPFKE